ncbi:DNA-binding transcriptional regulator, LysR family [Ferrimonas sediminum]|uniref:DNA-binding transcriptional regulator, LysR family n=1 Tax=Ferrimonas sediminum TaxID=718193 RepID=A0A1G8RDQ5_9GAMM|nr:LysR family transcriptional regulator [Ferrimonas sediminum]SDJ15049.1 DNA-binding transcriptional regulator, LysR family [Ferrimonas sediminum]
MKLEDLQLFQLVADSRSFTQAAQIANLPIATVSRRIKQLESGIGLALFVRTTRKLKITEAGRQLYQSSLPMVAGINDAIAELKGVSQAPKGRLRVQLFPDTNLLPLLLQFQHRHPGVQFDIVISDRELDLSENGVDLAIRIGNQPRSNQVVHRLGTMKRLVVASPGYLTQRGRPASSAELSGHTCIIYRLPGGLLDDHWHTRGNPVTRVRGDITINQYSMLVDLLLSGQGIGYLPSLMAQPLIEAGRLVPLFDHDPRSNEPLWLVYSTRPLHRRLLADFIDYLLNERQQPRSLYQFS